MGAMEQETRERFERAESVLFRLTETLSSLAEIVSSLAQTVSEHDQKLKLLDDKLLSLALAQEKTDEQLGILIRMMYPPNGK